MEAVKSLFLSAISALFFIASGSTISTALQARTTPPDETASAVVKSQQAGQLLVDLLRTADNIDASFQQAIYDVYGGLLEQSSGRVLMRRPHIRWEIMQPFAQISIASATQLRVYDPDLEQVIERDIDPDVEASPFLLLTRPAADVLSDYLVVMGETTTATALPVKSRLQFAIEPMQATALFKRIELTFLERTLTRLQIIDHAGQRTLITLNDVGEMNKDDTEAFRLSLPEGTDVVRG